VTYQKYDLRNEVHGAIFSGADYLVHCAYIDKAPQANLEGARRLLTLAHSHGLKRNIFISSLSAHEQALSPYGQQKYLCEQLFVSAADTIIRPALVLGHGGLFQRMSAYIQHGHCIPLIGGGRQPLQTVWIHDLTYTIEKIFLDDIHGTFALAHPEAVPYELFYRQLAAKLGVPPRFLPLPYIAVSSTLALASALGVQLPITRDNLLGLKAMRQVHSQEDLKKLGVSLRSFAETLQQL
jgi:NADH dehydrogenase